MLSGNGNFPAVSQSQRGASQFLTDKPDDAVIAWYLNQTTFPEDNPGRIAEITVRHSLLSLFHESSRCKSEKCGQSHNEASNFIAALCPGIPLTAPPRRALEPQKKTPGYSVSTPQVPISSEFSANGNVSALWKMFPL